MVLAPERVEGPHRRPVWRRAGSVEGGLGLFDLVGVGDAFGGLGHRVRATAGRQFQRFNHQAAAGWPGRSCRLAVGVGGSDEQGLARQHGSPVWLPASIYANG